ncbi:hypothetical protein QR680_005280 [Steinernema hermaphroditum]|uniref:ADP/ATP translocase n=1 Tax=Steinernema hermaphroditum TaxID=289476 RepID=A0AA39HRF3_9BILA|nr:hypothetical protein QR680_005280 [Steinernema hermaphroditum]
MSTKEPSIQRQFLIDFAAGGSSAALARTIVAPIDRVKLLLQNQRSHQNISVEAEYKGIADCFRRVWGEQGALSFWRGNGINVVRIMPQQALNFAFKDTYKQVFMGDVDKHTHFWKFFAGNLASGGFAGATSLCFIYPLDFGRQMFAMDLGRDSSQRQYRSLVDCFKKIYKTNGLIGLYRGFNSSVQGIFIYRGAYFGLFDTATSLVVDDRKKLNFFVAWGIGQVTTVTAGLVCYPWDTVRRRMMMQSSRDANSRQYKNTLHCWKTILTTEGPQGFYKGALGNVFRGMGSALVLAFYSEIMKHV